VWEAGGPEGVKDLSGVRVAEEILRCGSGRLGKGHRMTSTGAG
jgi:hypothetical protein